MPPMEKALGSQTGELSWTPYLLLWPFSPFLHISIPRALAMKKNGPSFGLIGYFGL